MKRLRTGRAACGTGYLTGEDACATGYPVVPVISRSYFGVRYRPGKGLY